MNPDTVIIMATGIRHLSMGLSTLGTTLVPILKSAGFGASNPHWAGLNGRPLPIPNPVKGKTIVVKAVMRDDAVDVRPAIQAAIEAAQLGYEVYLPDGIFNLYSISGPGFTGAH